MYAPSRKVLLIWELPFETAEFRDEHIGKTVTKPRVISKEYTLSLGAKANLRRDLESWRGKPVTAEEATGFEVGALAGVNCQLNVAHRPSRDNSRTYANVVSIVPLGKGVAKLKNQNPIFVWDIPQSGPFVFPDNMPEWIVTKIKGSEEYVREANPHAQPGSGPGGTGQAFATDGQPDEDVPF